MTSIQKVQKCVQALACTYIPKNLQHRFTTGVTVLSTTALSSLNANGRGLHDNLWTGESRVRRTVTDVRFPELLLKAIVREFLPRTGQLRLSLDHSTFGTFTIAVFALSAGKGHSLLKPLLHGFRTLLDQLSYQQRKRVVGAMDRWFAVPDLLEWLAHEHLGFVVRLKQNTPVGVPWVEPYKTIPAGAVSLPDTPSPTTGMTGGWCVVTCDQA